MTERKSLPDFTVRQSILCFLLMLLNIIVSVLAGVLLCAFLIWLNVIPLQLFLLLGTALVSVRMGQIAANQVEDYGGFGLIKTNLDPTGRPYRSYRRLWQWLVWIYALIMGSVLVIWLIQGLQRLAEIIAEENAYIAETNSRRFGNLQSSLQAVVLYIDAAAIVSLVIFAIAFTLFTRRFLQSRSPGGFANRPGKK